MRLTAQVRLGVDRRGGGGRIPKDSGSATTLSVYAGWGAKQWVGHVRVSGVPVSWMHDPVLARTATGGTFRTAGGTCGGESPARWEPFRGGGDP